MMLRSALNRLTAPLRRARGGDVLEGSRAASTTPLCREYGYSRGTPIDRHYIEAFLERHSSDIRDRVLEIGDDTYSRRFGSHRITQQDILHVHPGHPRATIVGDVAEPGVLPQKAFDCIILTQVLHLIFDMNRAVEQIHAALRPGGVALITVPGISPIHGGPWKDSWYWSLTDIALSRLLSGSFDAARVTVSARGNLFAATAFLHGAAVEEVGTAKLDLLDAAYPVTVTARAVA
jgi:SAM-dependent methyltransferase